MGFPCSLSLSRRRHCRSVRWSAFTIAFPFGNTRFELRRVDFVERQAENATHLPRERARGFAEIHSAAEYLFERGSPAAGDAAGNNQIEIAQVCADVPGQA